MYEYFYQNWNQYRSFKGGDFGCLYFKLSKIQLSKTGFIQIYGHKIQGHKYIVQGSSERKTLSATTDRLYGVVHFNMVTPMS